MCRLAHSYDFYKICNGLKKIPNLEIFVGSKPILPLLLSISISISNVEVKYDLNLCRYTFSTYIRLHTRDTCILFELD